MVIFSKKTVLGSSLSLVRMTVNVSKHLAERIQGTDLGHPVGCSAIEVFETHTFIPVFVRALSKALLADETMKITSGEVVGFPS